MALMWPMAFPPPLCQVCRREISESQPTAIVLDGDRWLGLRHAECLGAA